MQKTTTQKDLKVYLLKTFLAILILSISFQVSFAQEKVLSKPSSARKGFPTERPAESKPSVVVTPQRAVVNTPITPIRVAAAAAKKSLAATAEPSDVPSINKQIAAKIKSNPAMAQSLKANSPLSFNPTTPNLVNDVCTFNGSLVAGDLTLTNGRFFRDGVPSTCSGVKACPGGFGTGPYYYDTYTMQNLTCVSQCVTVDYIANPGGGDVFVTAYNGSFNPNSLCTNYIADGGLSSLAGGTPVSFSLTVPANATIVFVAMGAQISTECPSYTMTVTGINCTPPPVCSAPTSSILSQAQIPGPPVTLINEQFDGTIVPAGWAFQNLSAPLGLTNWSQTNSLVFPPQSGVGFASANFNNTAGVGTISNWMFAPNITFKNGDKFTFYTRTTTGTFPDRLQLRMSTNGASVNVGTNETSVGDFTTLLLDINPNLTGTGYPTAWTQFTVTMSGLPALGISGRLAFRYFVTGAGPAGANSDFIGIDNAVYTSFTLINPTTCTGSTANLKVDITGGNSAAYNVTINVTPAAPGYPRTILNYVSGSNIPVTPAVTSTYNLVSVIAADNPCCVGTGNSGTPTVTVSATTVAPITVVAAPSTPLCAGDPTLLTIIGAPTTGTQTTSSGPIAVIIPDANATGVSTPLTITGVPAGATGTGASVNFNITHTWDADINLFLKSPNNQVLNLVSAKGGSGDNFVNTTVNSTSTNPFPATGGTPFTGVFRPDGNTGALAPTGFASTGAINFVPLYNTTTANLNGVWSFGARDNAFGDQGTITSWSVSVDWTVPAGPPVGYTYLWTPATGISSTTGNPIAASPMTTTTYTVMGTAPNGCQTTGAITITVNQLPAITNNPSNLTVCAGQTATFTSTATGAGISYQWQLSTNGGTTWTNIAPGAPYTGVTTGTLSITPTTAAMNGYRYRLVVSGTCPPNATSTGAILTVNPLPAITVVPASPICGGIPGVNGTLITASGATTYTWSPAAGLYTNATATTPYVAGTPTATVYAAPTVNTTYTITGTNGTTGCVNTLNIDVNYKPAAPTVSPAAVTMCLGFPAVPLSITSSLVPVTSTFSSGAISVLVPDVGDGAPGISTIPVSGIPANATISAVKVTFNMQHTWVGDVDINIQAPNGKNLNLVGGLNGGLYTNSTDHFVNTSFSSLGGATISGAAAPRTGTYTAEARPLYGPDTYIQNTTTWSSLTPTAASANGNWIFAVGDWGAGDQGTITSWSIDITYGVPSSGVWTPNGTVAAGLYTDPGATILYTGTPANIVYAKPPVTTTYDVTVTSVGPTATPTFSNPALININDGSTGTPYPATLAVTGLPATGASVTSVQLRGVSHTWSSDIAIALQNPSASTNVVLMAGVGGASIITNANYTFTDGGAAMTAGAIPSGTYKPTSLGGAHLFPSPGPGSLNQTGQTLASFNSSALNGTWKLFVVDEVFGDFGTISGGYNISFSYPTVGCVSNSTKVTVTVNTPLTFVPNLPADAVVCTDKVTSFTSQVSGSVVNHNWRVSTNNGNNWSDVVNGGVYAGAKTATLTITAPPVSMTTYLYKDSVSTVACHDSSSRIAKLIVNPLPTIVISASPYQKLFPGLTTTLFSTVSPIASTYTWLKNGTQVPGSGSSLLVTVDGLGTYTLRVTDVNGCTNTSNAVSLTDSITGKLFVYPNPNNGVFQVRYYSIINNTNLPRGLNIYDSRGKRIAVKNYSINSPYARMDVDLRNYGSGVYWLELVDVAGNRLAMGRAEVLK